MEAQDHPTLSAMLLERFALKNPLAASFRLVLERIFETAAINALFEKNRCQQYTQQILFVTIVEVMFAVVSRKVDSAHAAMQQHGEALGASITAFYKKLNGTEPAVSTALVAHSFARGRELVTEMGGLCAEALPGWRLRILDGNHLAATERRLSALWQVSAGPLPGLALVVFDMAARMMSDVILCEDGHAQERSLTAQILTLVVRGDCWVADRNFCTQAILLGILLRDGAFVIRQHANLPGELVGPRRACGRCETGTLFEQQYQLSFEGETRTVRRVTLVLNAPIRDGEAVVRDQVSGYYIAQFGRDAVGAIDDMIEPADWIPWQMLSVPDAAVLLKKIAARIDLRLIRKHKRGPKKPVPERTRFKKKPHVSTQRLIDGRTKDPA